MRLVQCKTLQLEEFLNPPSFAILSHTWEKDEVTYQEMLSPTSKTRKKVGFVKVRNAARLAQRHGFEYIWIDTCSIDKSSSAELTEAINSMYKWYQQAGLCIALLSDVSTNNRAIPCGSVMYEREHHEAACSLLQSCRWITRGWTLQELIAPIDLRFYDSAYHYFGSKKDLRDSLSQVTGISRTVLESSDPLSASVAERMSWAASRKTTRIEDEAYCLMGLFSVNMPLLYGEGDRSFLRLQEEILRNSDDHSLFTWAIAKEAMTVDSTYRGLLARKPADFGERHGLHMFPSHIYEDLPTTITNKGVCLSVPLIPMRDVPEESLHPKRPDIHLQLNHTTDELFVAVLNCNQGIGIIVLRLEDRNQYTRVNPDILVILSPDNYATYNVYIRQSIRLYRNHQFSRLSDVLVSFNDYVNYTSGRDRKVKIMVSDHMFAMRKGFDTLSREHKWSWRHQNTIERLKYGAEEKEDAETDLWYNRWNGIASIALKYDRFTGVYEVKQLYDPEGRKTVSDFTLGHTKAHWNLGGKLTLATLGCGSVELSVTAHTELVQDHAVIVLDIREHIIDSRAASGSLDLGT